VRKPEQAQTTDGLSAAAPARREVAMNSEVEKLIDRLENLVNTAKRVPLSAMVMVDEQAFLDVIDQLRVAYPEEIRQARRVSQERDRMLAQAQTEADKLVQQAQRRADEMVSESEQVQAAEAKAEEVRAAAEARANELRQWADHYVLQALSGLDEELSRLLAQIRRGRALIDRPHDEAEGEDDGERRPELGV
jgi:vacuolar-type H+-ATPase subunit H